MQIYIRDFVESCSSLGPQTEVHRIEVFVQDVSGIGFNGDDSVETVVVSQGWILVACGSSIYKTYLVIVKVLGVLAVRWDSVSPVVGYVVDQLDGCLIQHPEDKLCIKMVVNVDPVEEKILPWHWPRRICGWR